MRIPKYNIKPFTALSSLLHKAKIILYRPHHKVLNKIKQSDFALSDSFLDIVKSFFSEFPDIVYGADGYNSFANFQRKHINPERINPIPIIKANHT